MITLIGINKFYNNGQTHVLKDVSMIIEKGQFVCICGPSGHGKTTLLSILSLLDHASSGIYRLEGIDVSPLNFDQRATVRAAHIGIIFQSFNLIGDYTVHENVALALKYAKPQLSSDETYALVRQVVSKVGLEDKLNCYPRELSGGQQQRVAIARALVNAPSIIFADEPTGNLDSKTAATILELLLGLNKEGVTICMVTHDAEISKLSDRIIHLHDGQIISDQLTDNIPTASTSLANQLQ